MTTHPNGISLVVSDDELEALAQLLQAEGQRRAAARDLRNRRNVLRRDPALDDDCDQHNLYAALAVKVALVQAAIAALDADAADQEAYYAASVSWVAP